MTDMTRRELLISVFEEAVRFVLLPENDFSWSSWEDEEHASRELSGVIERLRSGEPTRNISMEIYFVVTGPLQELSLRSGWSQNFLDLADRFDSAIEVLGECACETLREIRALGMDKEYGESSLWECVPCGRLWLRWFHENEAFSRSGRWYRGVVSDSDGITAENAKSILEALPSYVFGGSYFDGKVGQSSGPIL